MLTSRIVLPRFASAVCAIGLSCLAAGQTAPTAAQIARRLTANDLKADVSFLASDALEGRGTPSRGLDVAAEYIAAQFRRAGLEPAGDDGYFQTAAYGSVTPNLEGLEVSLEIGGQTVLAERTAIALQEPAAADLRNIPVFKAQVADAAAVDALGPEQTRGKALLVELAESAATGRGAFGVLRALSTAAVRLRPAIIIVLGASPRGGATTRLREIAAAPAMPILVTWDPNFQKVVAAASPGALNATISAHIAPPNVSRVRLRNVIGVLRGSDPVLKNTHILVTAHYDHLGMRGSGEGDRIFNGANDDASGTASVIEIANALAALQAHPKRSVVFIALFGEEMGLLGSRYYARHPVFPLANTVADLNLEQMGRTDDVTGPRVGLVNVTGYDYTSITEELAKAGDESGIKVVKDEQSSDPFYGRSDNQAFADAGIPSHTLSVGYVFPDYHKASDEWPKLDYENMAKVDRAVALAIFRLADNAEAPHWNTANPKTERYVKARSN